jgi:hypothetical protein
LIPSWVVAPTSEQIRNRFDYMILEWQDIREQARIDMQYCTGDPWDSDERRAREAMGRLCLDFDELTQYINQLINGVRQNRRAPKITPTGDGANDKLAEMVQGMIRNINYGSEGQAASITAMENMAMRSYGYTKIVREYIDDESDKQRLRKVRIPNPDVIYLDPDARAVDWSDMDDAFELDLISKDEFKERWPNAEKKDFTSEDMGMAPRWIKEDQIQIATYWKRHSKSRTRYRLDSREEPEVYDDELPEGSGIEKSTGMLERRGLPSVRVRNWREIKTRFVMAYLTNGLEILESAPWTLTVTNPTTGKKKTGCTSIPIIPYMGKEIWLDYGKGSRRIIQSLIRMARTPYMSYCYTRTAQLEEIQMTSKSPYWAVEGQLEGHEKEVKTLNKVPRAIQEYKATTEATGNTILPPPTRPDFIPNVQILEVYAQACRQAIQAAIGFSNPQAQVDRSAPLSGKAQQEFEAQGDIKTFHFIDNYDRALEREAQIIKEAIPVVYDTEQELAITGVDEKSKIITLNDPDAVDEAGQPAHYPTDQGEFDVTISVGPSMDSEREAADDFADTLLTPQLVQLGVQTPNSTAAKLLAQAIRLKNLGPIGDAMADAIDPPQPGQQIPPQVQQMVAQMKQQLAAAVQEVGKLQFELKQRGTIDILKMKNDRAISADKNIAGIIEAQIKAGVAVSTAMFEAEMERIENSADRMLQIEMAPGPDQGSQGLHPTQAPTDPNSPEAIAAQQQAQQAQEQPAGATA